MSSHRNNYSLTLFSALIATAVRFLLGYVSFVGWWLCHLEDLALHSVTSERRRLNAFYSCSIHIKLKHLRHGLIGLWHSVALYLISPSHPSPAAQRPVQYSHGVCVLTTIIIIRLSWIRSIHTLHSRRNALNRKNQPTSSVFKKPKYIVISAPSGMVWAAVSYWHFFGRLETIPALLSDDCHT